MPTGYAWHLPSTRSSHLCLAVEIATAQDPLVPPSLLGRAPGWPTTDLLVINDNNKAQRNMAVGPGPTLGFITIWALVHNGATIRRDIVLAWNRSGREALEDDSLRPAGGKAQALRGEGRLVVSGLKPGESRFVRIRLASGKGRQPDALVTVDEVVGGHRVVNGFAVLAQTRPSAEVTRYLVQRALSVYTRAEAFGVREAAAGVKRARALLKGKVADKAFVDFVRTLRELDQRLQKEVAGRLGTRGDPFELAPAQKGVDTALERGDVPALQSHYGAFLEGVDAALTTADIRTGDLADICQNVRWQAELFRTKKLGSSAPAKRVATRSDTFVAGFSARKVTAADYPKHVAGVLSTLTAAAKTLKSDALAKRAAALRGVTDPKRLQRLHWEYLDTLAELVGR